MDIISIEDIESLFSEIATRHKDIGHSDSEQHFVRLNMEDLLGSLRSTIKMPVLTLEIPEGSIQSPDNDQLHDCQSIVYMVLNKVKPNDYKAELEALHAMKLLGLDVLSFLRKTYRKPNPDKRIAWLKLDAIPYFKVGPLFDNHYGFRFEIELAAPVDLSFNASKWL